MRTPLVLGNWKMNGTRADNAALLEGITKRLPDHATAEIGVLPPFPYLPLAAHALNDTPIAWGAQDVSAHENGAYTGEVSAAMLADMGARWCLVGHSERRQYHAESDALIFAKAKALAKVGITPVLCVGESAEARAAGETLLVIEHQLAPFLAGDLEEVVLAYEPIWAIGTGQTASPTDAETVHAFIRTCLQKKSTNIADNTRILYGGSVNATNARALFAEPNIDGGLIGGASRSASNFITIYEAL